MHLLLHLSLQIFFPSSIICCNCSSIIRICGPVLFRIYYPDLSLVDVPPDILPSLPLQNYMFLTFLQLLLQQISHHHHQKLQAMHLFQGTQYMNVPYVFQEYQHSVNIKLPIITKLLVICRYCKRNCLKTHSPKFFLYRMLNLLLISLLILLFAGYNPFSM